jgi:GH25 family lysozyme M1 (1,4-beta-N-acetylmuramidase)
MIPGIDVSKWNGSINWEAVAAAGIKFAFIKCGGSDAGFYTDPRFYDNVKAANRAGIVCGAYYYVGPMCKSFADGEADGNRAAAICESVKQLLKLPLVIDFEAPDASNPAGNTGAVRGFCAAVRDAGFKDMVYASDVSGFRDRRNADMLSDIPRWTAKWSANPPSVWDVWQSTSEGENPGIVGPVDLDWMTVDTFNKYAGEPGGFAAALHTLAAAIQEVLKYVE